MKKQERKKKMIANAIADIAVADLANKGITATSPGSSIEDFDKTTVSIMEEFLITIPETMKKRNYK